MVGIAAGGMGIAALIAALFFGSQIIGALERHAGHKGKMGLGREELAFRREQEKTSTEASKRVYRGQRLEKERTWEQIAKLARQERGEKRVERQETREMASADRQMALAMAAVQALSQGGAQRDRNAPFSIVDLLRR